MSNAPNAGPSAGLVARTRRMDEIEETEVEWLWQHRLARGTLASIAGDPGVGKSTLTVELAAHITRGDPLPGGPWTPDPERVLFLSAEENAAKEIKPRLRRAGAVMERVSVLDGFADRAGRLHVPALSQEDHRAALEELLRDFEPGLVVLDPLMGFLGSINTDKDIRVRQVLHPLAAIARRYDVVILFVRHLRKSGGLAKYRPLGSIGITASLRSEMLVGAHPRDDDQVVICPTKNNHAPLAPSLAFTIGDASEDLIEFHGVTDVGPEDFGSTPERGPKLTAACEFIEAVFANRYVIPSNELYAHAKEQGLSKRTVKRALPFYPVEAVKVGNLWLKVWSEACQL